ncbi:MAG: YIP1 family protein [Ignavibacteriales bacterium]|nr:YIP1 family protein [Ignavibacteriales bacterium]
MLECSVCKTQNHHLAINCSSCGGYLQQKIETLDLFETAWMVVEHPSKAFHKIAISTHKNYILFLSALAGIGFLFSAFWFYKIGDLIFSLLRFLGIGISAGIIFGEVIIFLLSIAVWLFLKAERKGVKFRQVFAVTAYSSIPIIISAIIILPIEILTFGTHFFGTNPSPYLLKPLSYVVLLVIDGLFGLWSLILFLIAIKQLRGIGWLRSAMIEFISIVVVLLLIHNILRFIF